MLGKPQIYWEEDHIILWYLRVLPRMNSTNFGLPSKLQDWEKTWVLHTLPSGKPFQKKNFIEMILAGGLSRIGNARQTYCLLFWRKWPFSHDSTGKCYNINHISKSDDQSCDRVCSGGLSQKSDIHEALRQWILITVDDKDQIAWFWHGMRLSLLR